MMILYMQFIMMLGTMASLLLVKIPRYIILMVKATLPSYLRGMKKMLIVYRNLQQANWLVDHGMVLLLFGIPIRVKLSLSWKGMLMQLPSSAYQMASSLQDHKIKQSNFGLSIHSKKKFQMHMKI